MIEFFSVSWGMRIFITFILGLCVLTQTLALVINFYRQDQIKQRVFENLLEIAILAEIIVFSFMHGEVVNSYRNGIVVPIGYENIRIIFFLAILVLSIAIYVNNRRLLPLSVILAASVSLPALENITASFYPFLFVGALLFFLSRSIKSCVISMIAIRTSVSAFSIIHAVDNLHTGVLFCESDGYTILSNHQMQRLMHQLTGKVFRDSLKFYEMLISDEYISSYEKVKLEGQSVYLQPDGSAWMFTKKEIPFLMKKYIHISASDVSENWALTSKLQDQDQELREKSVELKNTISNLHILSKEKEIESARMRAHDILGQSLTVLLRTIQNEDNLDYDLLKSLSKDLLEEIKSEYGEASAVDELKHLQQTFISIGVDVNFKGQLPNDKEQASLFVDIIREGTANAVRHGLASQVNIEAEETEDSYNLVMSNIGHTTSEPITLGSGLTVMRKKILAQGGHLEISPYPEFTLSVILPGGEKSG